MKRSILYIIGLCFILLGISCSDTIPASKEISSKPALFPDYADVTILLHAKPGQDAISYAREDKGIDVTYHK